MTSIVPTKDRFCSYCGTAFPLVASVTAQALALVSAISPWFAWLHSLVVEE